MTQTVTNSMSASKKFNHLSGAVSRYAAPLPFVNCTNSASGDGLVGQSPAPPTTPPPRQNTKWRRPMDSSATSNGNTAVTFRRIHPTTLSGRLTHQHQSRPRRCPQHRRQPLQDHRHRLRNRLTPPEPNTYTTLTFSWLSLSPPIKQKRLYSIAQPRSKQYCVI